MISLSELTLQDIQKTDSAYIRVKISAEDIQSFAKISGDYSPIHTDSAFAKSTTFDRIIAHGMLVTSYVSTIVGMLLPGKNALIMSTQFNYLKPVFCGDEILVTAKVTKFSAEFNTIKLDIKIYKETTPFELVLEGIVDIKVGQNGHY